MTKRLKQVLLGVAALAAMGLGGSALAQGGTTPVNPTVESTSAPDRDTIQSGDQKTPDAPATTTASAAKITSAGCITIADFKALVSELFFVSVIGRRSTS